MEKDFFHKYIDQIQTKFKYEETSEIGYRTDFENLLKQIFESINVKRIDHDAKAKGGNKPDFVILKNDVPILYIEAKDIGISLDKVEKSEQMARYFGYSNLVLSDYLEFRFYRDGIKYEEPIKIGDFDIKSRTITSIPDNFERLEKTLIDFCTKHKEPIKKGEHLAKIMGGRAQRIRDNVLDIFKSESDKNIEITKVYETLKQLLVHDLSKESFADMYAQTLVYGLFVARFYDESPENFSRREAGELIPASNPFLGHFFDHISGRNFEKRLSFIVDELCEIFQHADVKELMTQYFKNNLFGEKDVSPDPVIHFYEDFLKEYDEDLRKKMGAYYTPTPVVNFIVRSVDEILRKDFVLSEGLADTTKLENDKHKVQILDPAVGTGTFIGAVIDQIHENFEKQKQGGRWTTYVHHDLLPRLHGFELMMSPYTIAHLKISMKLQETGFKYFNETREGKTRLGVYLTNSLEDSTKQQEMLAFDFGAAIAEEAKRAAVIKNETPIMVVVGNPPYSSVSSNKNINLSGKYKFEPGGKIKLKERKNWLDDDYVKFISLAENLINKNKDGILAYITNNGFIDNPTFRGMRWHLLESFSEIYVLNLHGNSKKKEKTPDGGKDENVFNIMQGVSINIFVKKEKNKNCKIFTYDLYGKRNDKFSFLNKNKINSIEWKEISPKLPNLFFVEKGNKKDEEDYNKGFSVGDLFINKSCGIVTMGDNFIIDNDKDKLKNRVESFLQNDITASNLKSKYELGKNYAEWLVSNKTKIVINNGEIVKINYRPFDDRFTIYNSNLIWRTRGKAMKNVPSNHYSLIFEKIAANKDQPVGIFVSKNIIDCHLTGGQSYIGSLYSINDRDEKNSNLNEEIIREIEKIVGKTTPEDIFDYIYAVLHSPNYREKYKEFLKINFPRVPYPKDKKQFEELVKFGRELREIHLLESPKVNQFITSFPISSSDVVEKVTYKDGKVFINSEQYFGDVPKVAWDFYIGGYQPAQKWLKDRKGKKLIDEDLKHYQKIIVTLAETDRIMKEIDKIF